MRYWLTDLARDDATDSEVWVHLVAELQRAGLGIVAPQYSVRMFKENEKQSRAQQTREMVLRLKALRQIDIFAHLQEDELLRVAERLVFTPFAPGDVMTRQGADAHWLYLLVQGEAQVVFEDAAGRYPVSRLHDGTVFGERGMMFGERRSATVTVIGDVKCYRLDRTAFEDTIRSRPQMAEDISRILVLREVELQNVRQSLDTEARASELNRRHGEILVAPLQTERHRRGGQFVHRIAENRTMERCSRVAAEFGRRNDRKRPTETQSDHRRLAVARWMGAQLRENGR